jgi:replicative superfamily II helicase
MPRLIDERTHPPRRDVQQVAGTAGRIGKAGAKRRVAIDQRDARARRRSAQQVQREQRAAGSRANDGNGVRRHGNILFPI